MLETQTVKQDTREPKKLVVNKELTSIVPKMSEQQYRILKDDIAHGNQSKGYLKDPIEIAVIGDIENTVIDGHHCLRAFIELQAEDKIPLGINVPVKDAGSMPLQEAKEYVFSKYNTPKDRTEYTRITSALMTFYHAIDADLTNADYTRLKEILRLKDKNPIEKVRSLNKLLVELSKNKVVLPNFVGDWIDAVRNGIETDVSYATLYNKLLDAKEVQEVIDLIDDDQFRTEMYREFFEKKYKEPKKKVLAALNSKIDKHDHPERYGEDAEQKKNDVYLKAYTNLRSKVDKIRDKYPNDVTVFTVATKDYFDGAIDSIKRQLRDTDEKFCMAVFFKVPSEEDKVT